MLSSWMGISRLLVLNDALLSGAPTTALCRAQEAVAALMQRGSCAPFEWYLDLRVHAMAIVFSETAKTCIDWKDSDTIMYRDITLSVSEYAALHPRSRPES